MISHPFFRWFDQFADSVNAVPAVRKAVLQLAIQGRLVCQDTREEPAQQLLERARSHLPSIKNNLSGNSDFAAHVNADYSLSSLPPGWVLAKISDFAVVKGGKRLPAGYSFSPVPTCFIYIQVTNMKRGTITSENLKYIQEEVHRRIVQYTISKEDLYITIAGTIGQVGEVPAIFDGMNLTENAAKIVFKELNKRFLLMALNSPFVQEQFLGKVRQMAQPKLALRRIADSVVPIPPLAEQERIVAKADELLALCDALETRRKAQSEARRLLHKSVLHHLVTAQGGNEFASQWARLRTAFDVLHDAPDKVPPLRQTILQLAVRGRLAAQDPSDEPAAQHLRRISGGDHWQTNEGSFNLPSGWTWARLEALGTFLGGGTPSTSNADFWDGTIPWVSPKDMKVRYIVDAADHVSEAAIAKSAVKLVPTGSLLVVVRGMILAHSFPVALTTREVVINQDMKALTLFDPALGEYLVYALCGLKDKILSLIERSSHGTCRLDSSKLRALTLPIPPLPEQQRIVENIRHLSKLCDELEASLKAAETRLERLLTASVHDLLRPKAS